VWVGMACRFTNLTGTGVFSAAANDDGSAIAGTYLLTFSSVSAGVSATVTVSSSSANNPYNARVKTTRLLDETTVYSDVIPGIDIVFDAAAANGNTSQIRVGFDHASLAAFPPAAGTPGTPRRIKVTNNHPTDPLPLPAATLKTMAKRFKKTGVVFLRTRPFAPTAVEKLDGNQVVPYVLAVSGVTGSGAAKVMDLKVDTVLITTVTNLTDLTTSDSSGLNVVDYYRIETGDLTSLEFKLSEDAVNSDFENLLIFPARYLQIAPDVGGPAPGAWGVTDLALADELAPLEADAAYYWQRPLVPDGANSESNPYPMEVCLEGQVASGAGWDA